METTVNSSRWSVDETKMLLSFWCEENVQDQLDGTVRDAEVYKKLEKCMRQQKINRNAVQIKTRLKVLKKSYREQKDKLNTTGEGGKIKFMYYTQMDSVLGHRQGTQPSNILETAIPGLDNHDSSHTINTDNSILSNMEEEIPDSDLDTTQHSVAGDPSGAEEQNGQSEQQNDNLNDSVAESEAGPSSSPGPSNSSSGQAAPKERRKRKTLKDILPQTIERCFENFLSYQKEMEKELLEIEKEQLRVKKENLQLQRQTYDLLKKAFE